MSKQKEHKMGRPPAAAPTKTAGAAKQVAVAAPPVRARPPFQPAQSHLVAERFELHDRHRLLARLAECLARGLQDPELLYLGGRYAASLGLNALACRFLDPLSTLLHEDGRPAPAFFPVGLLYLGVVEPAKREIVLEELRQLAAASPHLTRILHLVGGDAQGRLLAGSPPPAFAAGRTVLQPSAVAGVRGTHEWQRQPDDGGPARRTGGHPPL
jgi:hypothetical protein